MPTTAARRLYDLLDALVALRLEYARHSEADKELSSLGREKILEVRIVLDSAIHGVKEVIGDIDRPQTPNSMLGH
jgi:hypothetical protein